MVGRFLAAVMVTVTAAATAAHAQQVTCPPAGVTPQAIKQGEAIFKGPGQCSACHGADAKGLPGVGPSLADQHWLHGRGTYDEIVTLIATGVSADASASGSGMPPKGGSGISDDQVKAVAAYVWSLSHTCK